MQARFIFLIILLLVIDLMAFQAVRHLIGSSGKSLRMAVYAVYWFIPVISMAYLLAAMLGWSDSLPRMLQVILRAMIFILYFAKLLMAAVILIDDIRRLLFGALNLGFTEANLSTSRSQWMSYGAILLGAIPLFSLTYGMARNPYRYKVHRSRIPVKNLHPDLTGLRIGQISDIHSGSFLLKEPVERSVEMIMAEKPDIIFFTGDLVNSLAREMEPFIDIFSQLRAPLGVYSVLGNHDYGDYHHWPDPEDKKKNFADLLQMHERLGWQLLLNEHRQIPVKSTFINVIGVENYSANPRFPKYGDLKKATSGMVKDTFNVLLSHDPSHWEEQVVKDHPEIDLTLSGHTHGFQFGVEIPGYLKWSPIQYVYPQWAGLYEKAEQFLYVNRGLGYLGYPGRVGILPEITIIDLESL
jgi:predicted MPP superfamily phosphohydrolase